MNRVSTASTGRCSSASGWVDEPILALRRDLVQGGDFRSDHFGEFTTDHDTTRLDTPITPDFRVEGPMFDQTYYHRMCQFVMFYRTSVPYMYEGQRIGSHHYFDILDLESGTRNVVELNINFGQNPDQMGYMVRIPVNTTLDDHLRDPYFAENVPTYGGSAGTESMGQTDDFFNSLEPGAAVIWQQAFDPTDPNGPNGELNVGQTRLIEAILAGQPIGPDYGNFLTTGSLLYFVHAQQ